MKKVFSITISLIMALTIFSGLDVSETHATTVVSRTGNDGITWVLDSNGTLTLSGNGEMDDIESSYATGGGFAYEDEDPYDYKKWHVHKDEIKKIIVKSGITKIGQYAFYGCQNVTSISIPKGVQVGAYAFASCTGLTTVSIPDNVSFPGLNWNINGTSYAFRDCIRLKTLTIGQNVDLSTQAAFMGCTALSNLTLGNGDTISSSAFKNDQAIATLTIDTGTDWAYNAFQWCPNISTVNITGTGKFSCVVVDGSGYRPWAYSDKVSSVTVEEGVAELDQGLFYCANPNAITKITLPSTLTKIGRLCFYNSTKLQSITIPKSVTSIGDDAFGNVNATFYVEKDSYAENHLKSLGKTVSNIQSSGPESPEPQTPDPSQTGNIVDSGTDSNISWSLDDKGTLIIRGNGAMSSWLSPWKNRTDITDVIIEKGITDIGVDAFSGCTSLKSITLPEGLTSIGGGVFYGCKSLMSITLPEGITSIGKSAFYNCNSLTDVMIPNGVTSIGDYAFMGCKNLTSIEIPEGLTSIGGGAFYGCKSLTSITLPEGLTSIGTSVFRYCENLTSIEIPEGLTSIGDNAFWGCTSLKSITLPEGITSIGKSAFYNCNSLTDVMIPNGVTSIEADTFAFCGKLKSITIPNNVTSIGEGAFLWCKELKCITIPNGATSIGKSAFESCLSLTNVTIPDSVTMIGDSAFKSAKKAVILVNNGSYAHSYVKENGLKYDLPTGHQWEHIIERKALVGRYVYGREYTQCSTCKEIRDDRKIPPAVSSISKKTYTYNGKVKKPKVAVYEAVVIDGNGEIWITLDSSNYTVSYSNNKNVGKAIYSVTFNAERQEGTYSGSFKIIPQGTFLKNLEKGKNTITVKWKKQSKKMSKKRVTGYQILLATNKKFTKNKKFITVKGYKKTSRKVKSLKWNTKYYVKIRTYMEVGKSKYYSKWSKTKAIKTAKKKSKSGTMKAYNGCIKDGNNVYCCTNYGIYKVNITKGTKKRIVNGSDYDGMASYYGMRLHRGYLYYCMGIWDGAFLNRIKISGKSHKKLADVYGDSLRYEIKGKKIYYRWSGEEDSKTHKRVMSLNGKNKKKTSYNVKTKYVHSNKKGYKVYSKYSDGYMMYYLKTPEKKILLAKAKYE